MRAQQQQHVSSMVTDAQATDMTLVVQRGGARGGDKCLWGGSRS